MNEKTNNKISNSIKIAVEVGILLFAVAIAWATLRGDVENNAGNIETNTTKLTKHSEKFDVIQEKSGNVKADIREIKTILKERLPK